jgi:phenylacetate-CoA ligase
MPWLEEIYRRLPSTLQHVACSVEGWRVRRERYNEGFRALLRQYEERTAWPPERLMEYQAERLQSFLRGPAARTPYYCALFRRLGIEPEDIQDLDDLRRLPILRKSDLQARPAEFRSEDPCTLGAPQFHTSGATGAGLQFARTRDAEREQWAVWWRYRRWHGLDLGTWCAYFGGRSVVLPGQSRPPFWRWSRPTRQVLFSGYHMSERNMPYYVEALRKAKPPWLHGYPSLLALLAAWLVDRRTDVGYPVKWVTIGAENLMGQQTALIEQAFGVRPRQHYGMAEGVANVSECERGRLHVDEDYAGVEFLPCGAARGWSVIGTNWTNPATPLLRYDVQDVVELAEESKCPCGRPGRLLVRIDGRHEDYVVLRDGTRLGRLDHMFKDQIRIREAQIRQRRAGELIVLIVKAAGYGQGDEDALAAEIGRRVGDRAQARFEYVDRLERTPTGKLRFVVSEMAGAKIDQPALTAAQEAT